MNLNSLGFFNLIERRLDWLSQRQTVIAQNIANADTPEYRARDLKPFAGHLTDRLRPAATQAGHIGVGARPGAAGSERQRDLYETAPDGNEVVLEQQLLAMNETGSAHQTALNLYRKQLGMIRMALGTNRG